MSGLVSIPNGYISTEVPCISCGNHRIISCDPIDYMEWLGGKLIQNAMPYLSIDDREMLISRICPDCWKNMYGSDDDEDCDAP